MIVAPTVGPSFLTVSTAMAVVQCSRTMRRFGKRVCKSTRVGRKVSSAFRMVVVGEGGDSPWMLRTIPCSSMAAKTG